jgi:hypothetical protein
MQTWPVANWITWEEHHTNPPSSGLVNWALWDDGRKKDLRDAYAAATKWYDGGMTTYTGTHVDDVPVNREEPWVETTTMTVLDDHTAWSLYVAHVAFSLAAEINARCPPSYDAAAMQDLFRSNPGMFIYTPPSPTSYYHSIIRYVVTHESTPTHPTVSFVPQDARPSAVEPSDARERDRPARGTCATSGRHDRQPVPDGEQAGAPPVARVLSVRSRPSVPHDLNLHN